MGGLPYRWSETKPNLACTRTLPNNLENALLV